MTAMVSMVSTMTAAPGPSTSGPATRPGWRRTFLPSSTSTKTRLATARSSGRFPFQGRAAPETSRTIAISPPTRTSWRVAACWRCCAVRTASSSSTCPKPRHPRFLFSTSGTLSNITDDFLPLKDGGFLVTQMGSHTGGTPGRVAEFDARSAAGGRMACRSAGARFQPARHLGPSGSQPDGDLRLHDARQLVERGPRRSAAARNHPRVGSSQAARSSARL